MAVGEKKRDERGIKVPGELSPASSQKPTLAGISGHASEQPKRVTVAGVAPPGPGSDRPPPMSRQEREEFSEGLASTEPPPLSGAEAEARRRSSHTRGTQRSGEGHVEVPPHDPLPEELITQPEPFEAPRPPTLEADAPFYGSEPPSFEAPEAHSLSSRQSKETEVDSCEKITRPEILKSPEARELYKTAPGGGRNRLSGGREHAAAYVSPATVPPSLGRTTATGAIRVDTTVLNESRSHETEPSLWVRRQSSLPPPWLRGQPGAPSAKKLGLIVVTSAVLAGFSVWFALKVAEPPAAAAPRPIPLSQPLPSLEASSPAAKAALERPTQKPSTEGETEAAVEPAPDTVNSPVAASSSTPAPPPRAASVVSKPLGPSRTKEEPVPAPAVSEPPQPPKSKKVEEPWLD